MACGWFGHTWNKWEQYIWTGTITLTGMLTPKEERGKEIPCQEKRQRRTCERCGYTQDELIS